jgi:6,7-dimethyl-8-ribityllumazine synthase
MVEFGALSGRGLKIGIVKSRWNSEITNELYRGAFETLKELGIANKNISYLEVPGSFELAIAAQKIIKQKKVDAVLALGCVIKGDTPHDVYIASAVSEGIMQVSLNSGVPVIFGVLTCLNEAQAQARSTGKNNHGTFWAKTAVEMAIFKKRKI